jgi:hypothetical protein
VSVRNPVRRTVPVPDAVHTAAGLGAGERVLAGAQARDGAWLLASRDALVLVSSAAEPVRIPWERVERADWDRDQDRLVVTEVGEYGELQPRHVYALDHPGLLLDVLRERVTASVVLQRHVPVQGRRGLFVVARRPPTGDGPISWAYEFQAGVDPHDPEVAAAAEAGLRRAAEELGQ